jgi:PTH1 family peptidyl-tRNA hydrolase
MYNMFLVIGLGNPDEQYKNTRHNVGYRFVDALLKFWQTGYGFNDFKFTRKYKSEIARGEFENRKTLLVKPTTYMNSSGEAIYLVEQYYKVPENNIIVIHDDMDLPFGSFKISFNVSAAGHKGVQSLIDHLQSQEFVRIRIGIGKSDRIPPEKYVLENFTDEENKTLEKMFAVAMTAVETIIIKGKEEAMNLFNK